MVDHHESDRLLPIANVGRIMKQILPPSAKISKGSKETMQEYVTEFIGFVTGEASDKCHKENRKTVNGDDICWALTTLGFDNYGEAITQYLHKFREYERERACQGKAEELGGDLLLGNNSKSSEELRDDESIKFGNDEEGKDDQLPSLLEFRIMESKGKIPFRNNPQLQI